MIYLDNSASTPVAPDVLLAMERARSTTFGNASSVHRGGQSARVLVETAREVIAAALGAEPREIVFVASGTEANNLALKGYALRAFIEHGRWPTVLTSPTEHHSVLHPAQHLERMGAVLIHLPVNHHGYVPREGLRTTLAEVDRSIPPLVSLMHANNETGAIAPIGELAEEAHEFGAIFHTDAVQSFTKIDVNTRALPIDMATISAHKLHGPKGIGALFLRGTVELESLVHGGAQERNRRGGTEPVELIVGFAEAVRLAIAAMSESMERVRTLRDELRARIVGAIERVHVITPEEDSLPTILDVTFDDAESLDGEGLIVGMDLQGVAVSNGAACTSGSMQPSHVLAAMGLAPAQARAAVRFSLSRYTTQSEIADAAEALGSVVKRMRARASGSPVTL